MSEFIRDLKTIYQLIKPRKKTSHQKQMEEFYKDQADSYDSFRKRLLPARADLFKMIEKWNPGPRWVDFGAGTGSNLEYINLKHFEEIYLVDLSQSLLKIAEERCKTIQGINIQILHQDVLDFNKTDSVDLVTFSYSLTMIPNWMAALEKAYQILKPGGLIAVVDFHIPPKDSEQVNASFFDNHFWPAWFAWDGVYLSRDHVTDLKNHFSTLFYEQDVHELPYLPFSKVPYYLFIGQK
jgi:S-adenosylmethionine-diacylgycerolhomoserine-N-methlytransferase